MVMSGTTPGTSRTSSGSDRWRSRTPTGTEVRISLRSPAVITRREVRSGQDGGDDRPVAVEKSRVADDLVAVGERGADLPRPGAAGPGRDVGEEVGHGAAHPSTDEASHAVEVLAERDRHAGVLHRERDPQVRRHCSLVERRVRHGPTGPLAQQLGQHLHQWAFLEPQPGEDRLGGLAERCQLAAHVLGEGGHQRDHQLAAEAGHLPVEVPRPELVEQRQRHVDGHAVVLVVGVEHVGEREPEPTLAPVVGEVRWVVRESLDADEVVPAEREQVGLVPARFLPPAIEVTARHHRVTDPGVVERPQRGVVVEEVGAAELVAERASVVQEGLVVGEEPVPGVPLASDEGVVDEQLVSEVRIDAVDADRAGRHHREPMERPLLGADGTARPIVPADVGVVVLHEWTSEVLHPLRLDGGHAACPQPVRLHQLRRHDPLRWLAGQHRPRRDLEPRAAGAPQLAGVAVAPADLGQEAGQDGTVHLVGLGIPIGGLDADGCGGASELAVEVAPLPHPEVVQELGLALPAEAVGRQRPAALLEVVPEGHQPEEVRARHGETAV